MPGIFGYIEREAKAPKELATHMKNLMKHKSWHQSNVFHGDSFFLGIVALDSFLENDELLEVRDQKICVVAGNIYDKTHEVGHTTAKHILALYGKGNLNSFLESIKQLNSSFVFAIYDEKEQRMIAGNDRYGSRNIFYVAKPEKLIFSSEIKPILRDPLIHPELNLDAIGEFFTFSHLLGNKTFFKGINVLPPASILLYDYSKGKTVIRRYWDFEFQRKRKPVSLDYYVKEFDIIMEKAVERRMRDKGKIGIFLSGGLDSRLIAGFAKKIADRMGKELISYTFGTKGGYQENIARQVADQLDIENKFYEIPADFIARFADEIVYNGDGLIRIRDAHFISLLDKVRREVDTVLVGLFGSELFGEVLSRKILNVHNDDEIITYLFDRYEVKQKTKYMPKIFSENLSKSLMEKVKNNFIRTIKEIPFRSYDEIADYWELRQRDRRYILPLSTYMDWYLDIRLPYLDNEVTEFAINLPLELRFGKSFIHKAIKSLFPSLAKIPWEKSGVPPDTKRLTLLFSRLRSTIMNATRRFLERASGGRILFQPSDYRGYSYWLRTGSRRYVEKKLLEKDEQGPFNKLFNQEYVRKILVDHMKCREDNDQLICDLLNLKLLLEMFFK